MNTMHESTSAAATFKSADGLLNFDAVFKLQTQIADILKKAQKAGKDVKATGYFVVSTRAKPVAYSAASAKKDDIRYQVRRATKVASRKNVKPEALARVKILLTLLDGADVPAALKAKIKDAATAISQHSAKLEKVKASIDKKKAVLREASEKAHGLAVADLKKVLEAGGVPEKNIVEAQGFMGKAILVKLSATSVVSIGKSDIKKFNAARRANTSTSAQVSESAAKGMKAGVAALKSLFPKVKPDTKTTDFPYVIVEGEPRQVVRDIKREGWSGSPSSRSSSYLLTNSKFPGVELEVSFAEDMEDEEYEQWGLDPEGPEALVAARLV